MTFEELGLSPKTLRALAELNFTEPTPIQEQAIPKLLEGDIDLLGLAQTGTGKTAAFALPILEKIDGSSKKPQALILCPTRELCMQITKDIEKFSAMTPEIRTVAVYGGASISMQIRDLRRGVQIIVATPGRMIDIIERGEVNFENVKIVVLDEADEMLNMGFKESINQILSNTPDEKNTWLFTATMPKDIKIITKKYMKNPVEVSVSVNKGNDNIEHQYYVVNPRDRYAAVKRIVDFYPDIFGIVFCRTKNETKDVADMLIKDGYNSDALHGDLTQQQRDIVMNRYRDKNLQLLIATDVAARGIDVSNVTHVINYALPDDAENYTHRSGRTARAGKKGISISLVSKRETFKINELERIVSKKFVQMSVPSGDEVCQNQLLALIQRAKAVEINETQLAPFMDQINTEFEELTKEDVIKRFASMEFNRFLEYYQDARDLNMGGGDFGRSERPRGEKSERFGGSRDGGSRDGGDRGERGGFSRERSNSPQSGYDRFFINVGHLDNVNKGELLRLVCDNANVRGGSIGRIDMKDKFSFFEVETKFKKDILDGLKNINHNGRSLRVDQASDAPMGDRPIGDRPERSERTSSFGGERKSSFGGGSRDGGGSRFGGGSRDGGSRFGGGSRDGGSRDGGGSRFGGNRDGGSRDGENIFIQL
jgi:ATP-dependent RNA helicase DeaD